jgi:ATP-dependent exoDNAse (exonuclease V) beta subunit
MNLYYVAVTRPLEELWFFGTPSPTAFPAHAVAGSVPVVIPELETKVAAPPAPAPAVVQPPAPVASPAAPATARASKTKSALIQLLNDHDLSERALRELLARAQSYLD